MKETCIRSARIPIEILPHARAYGLPSYATPGAAGVDLFAAISEDMRFEPLERGLVSAGIRIALPEGLEAQIRPRSGLALKHGVTLLNAPGTIDSDYRGEIKVIVINLSEKTFVVTPGMRIAQMVVAPVLRLLWDETAFPNETARGDKGFGSTGMT